VTFIVLTVMFNVKVAKNGEVYELLSPFGMGDNIILPALQKIADGLKKDEIIQELNQD
jgi:hypothetical protein